MAVITNIRSHAEDGEGDRASITANGIVIDVIARDDGDVYVECYAHDSESGRQQAIVKRADTNRYQTRSPNLTLGLAQSKES